MARRCVLFRFLLFLWMGVACSVASPAVADAGADAPESTASAALYTAGPGADLFSLWGHSGLCIRSDVSPEGRCYDFGTSWEENPVRLSLGTLRGEALFVPISLPEANFVERYAARDLWRQDLPLPAAGVETLQGLLDDKVRRGEAYAYQPFFDNCSTRLRDLLDRAGGGKLRSGTDALDGAPLRSFAEQGLSGRLLPLVLVALTVGGGADGPTSAWQRMAFPQELRDQVARSLDAPPIQVKRRFDQPLPTSPAAGRLTLLLLGGMVAFGVLRARKKPALRRTLVRVWSALLGTAALLALWSSRSALPELQGSWVVLLLLPTDWLAALGPERWWRPYAAGRLVCTGLVLVAATFTASLVPLLWVTTLVVLPFGALLLPPRERKAAAGDFGSSPPARTVPPAPGST